MCVLSHFSHVLLFAVPWTVVCQAPLSMGFSRQEYWSGLPFPFPGNLPNPGIESSSHAWQVDSLPLSHLGSPEISHICKFYKNIGPCQSTRVLPKALESTYANWGEDLRLLHFLVNLPLNTITSNFLLIIHMILQHCTIKLKLL